MFKKILVPVDPAEAELGKPAVEHAAEFARRDGADMRLISVITAMPGMVEDYLPQDYMGRAADHAEANLKQLGEGSGVDDAKLSTVVKVGGVHHEVLAEAKDWGADLIVMCSHKPALSTYLLGSNAAHIVRHAACSVTVLR